MPVPTKNHDPTCSTSFSSPNGDRSHQTHTPKTQISSTTITPDDNRQHKGQLATSTNKYHVSYLKRTRSNNKHVQKYAVQLCWKKITSATGLNRPSASAALAPPSGKVPAAHRPRNFWPIIFRTVLASDRHDLTVSNLIIDSVRSWRSDAYLML